MTLHRNLSCNQLVVCVFGCAEVGSQTTLKESDDDANSVIAVNSACLTVNTSESQNQRQSGSHVRSFIH